jgi:hypothetical protein
MGISPIRAGATYRPMTTTAPYDAKMLELLVAYRQTPSIGLWDQLVRLNSGLVRRVVCRLPIDSRYREDLESAGFVGLSAALAAFDPFQADRFSLFAISYIQAAVVARLAQLPPQEGFTAAGRPTQRLGTPSNQGCAPAVACPSNTNSVL